MKFILSLIIFTIVFIISLGVGRYYISPPEVISTLFLTTKEVYKNVIFDIRLPRAIMSALCGGILSLCGLTLQGVFKNPLVGPHIIGVSSAAAFGGALCILLGYSGFYMIGFSFGFGVIVLFMLFFLAKILTKADILSLILSGIVINGFFAALISLLEYLADNEEVLPNIIYWLMGSFVNSSYDKIFIILVISVPCVLLLFLLRYRLNLLSLHDEDLAALGVNFKFLRVAILIVCTLLISTQVSVSGSISWVGLVVPHMTKFISGDDHVKSVPMSFVLGATFMLLIDNISRTLSANEIPLGILNALIGSPIFIYLLKKSFKNAS